MEPARNCRWPHGRISVAAMLSLVVPDFKFKIRSDAAGIHEIVAGFFGLAKSGGFDSYVMVATG